MVLDAALRSVLDAAVPFALPLRRPFRGTVLREGMLIKGPSGWGEFAPFDDYSDAAASRWLDSALEAAFGSYPAARRAEIEVNAIIPAVASADATGLARDAVIEQRLSHRQGQGRLARTSRTTRPGWRASATSSTPCSGADAAPSASTPTAPGTWRAAGSPCAGSAPTASSTSSSRAARSTRCANSGPSSTSRSPSTRPSAPRTDPDAIRVREYADVAVLKPAPLGGVAALVRVAEAIDVPVVVSGSLDSSVGLDVAVAAAAALDDLPFACGLGTGALLAADVVESSRVPEGGVVAGRPHRSRPVRAARGPRPAGRGPRRVVA